MLILYFVDILETMQKNLKKTLGIPVLYIHGAECSGTLSLQN